MRTMIFALALAAAVPAGAMAADCTKGSDQVLVVDDWLATLGPVQTDGTRSLTVEMSYTSKASKAIKAIDGDVVFSFQTGEIYVSAPIQADLHFAPGGKASEKNTRNIVNDPLERLIRASRADVVTKACVTLLRFEDGTEQKF